MEKTLKKAIKDVPDFPKKGIIFKDLTPVFSDAKLFDAMIKKIASRYRGVKIDAVLCAEARGFLIGAPLACRLKAALVPVRKPGKLPRKTFKASYALEYGTDSLEIHADAVKKGQRVLVIDDVLATGGTAAAVVELAKKCGAKVAEAVFVIELDFLKGREKLKNTKVFSLVHY